MTERTHTPSGEVQAQLDALSMPICPCPADAAGHPCFRVVPRYVQVGSLKLTRCSTCGREIPRGETHAYDRVRGFGQLPRRWCAACWAADPRPQVIR
jgi:hypothetical protein